MPSPREIHEVINLVRDTAHKYGVSDAYFVGGYPRNLAMGLPLSDVNDLDIASGTPKTALELAGWIAEAGKADNYEILHRTNTVRIMVDNVEMDFQGSTSHEDVAPYVRLWGVEETQIAKNIFDRDFTMNSLAIQLDNDDLIDMTKRGLADIKAKKVVTIIPAEIKVPKDPLIITRAIRMSAKYGFEIDPDLWKQMRKHSGMLERKLSPERLSIEAYTLSKYPHAKGLIDLLGIKYLEAPKFIQKGKEEAEE